MGAVIGSTGLLFARLGSPPRRAQTAMATDGTIARPVQDTITSGKRDERPAETGVTQNEKKRARPNYLERMKQSAAEAAMKQIKTPQVLPRAADIMDRLDRTFVVQPDATVVARIGNPEVCFCFAVHVHGWPEKGQPGHQGDVGRFGFYTWGNRDCLEYARIVQLGWVAGRDSATQIFAEKNYTVRPEGVVVSELAARHHGITREYADRAGRSLKDVLNEFADDLTTVLTSGRRAARIIAHHLEYHATIVEHELGRAGLTTARDLWVRLVREQGYCTMNPALGRWLRVCSGQEVGAETAKHTLSLQSVADAFWLGKSKVVTSGRDTTGTTASLLHRVYTAIVARAHGAVAALSTVDVPKATLPAIMANRLGDPEEIISVDVETHGWPPSPTQSRNGALGWHLRAEEGMFDFSRIIQLGWVIGRADLSIPCQKRSLFIKPDGFVITSAAVKYHGITQEHAAEHGYPLQQVLNKFMEDVEAASSRGARLCAHSLEFDAGLLIRELQRCGLDKDAITLEQLAMRGYCTMNPELGSWVIPRLSKEKQTSAIGNRFVSLPSTATALNIERCEELLARHHDACADAEVAFLIYAAMLKHAREEA